MGGIHSLQIFFGKKIFLCTIIILGLLGCSNEKTAEVALFPETVAIPPGGNYPQKNFPVVTLQCNKPATIYYTLNGELPEIGRSYTFSGRSPVTGIEIRLNTTLRFFAIDDEGNQEMVKTEVYTIDPPPKTSAAPKGGTFNKPVRVTLVPDEEATIYYTLDGSTPTVGSFVYSGPILISDEGITVLKFFAVDLLGNQEDVKVEQYIIDVTPPETTALPSGGRYSSKSTITLIANEPATIYYKLCVNEYNPDKCKDPAVSDPDVLVGDTTVSGIELGTGVLKYFSIDRAGNRENVKTQVYLSGNSPYTYAYPSGGLYRTPQLVQLYSDVIPGATAAVYYTTDGTDPGLTSPSCLSPCNILVYSEGTNVLKFFARDSLGNTEQVRTEVYTIDSIPPTTTITPPPGEYVGSQGLTLVANEPATIYYTLDGSTPQPGAQNTLSGISPVSGIVIGRDTTIKFMSFDAAGNVESSVKSATYSILMKFTEEFNDTSKKDNQITDADWNTDEGHLKLSRKPVTLLKAIPTGGTSYGFYIYNNHLFLADGSRGLKIYDISFPADPQLKGAYPPLPGETFYAVAVRENTAYIGTNSGVITLDVSDPSNPLFIERWNLSGGSAYGLNFYGKYIIISAGIEGLWIKGVANLRLTESAVAMALYGTILYVADTGGDVKVVDISNPQNPRLIRTLSVPGGVLSVTAYGNILFAGTDNGIIYRFALEDPEKPVFVSSLTLRAQVNVLNCSGRYLFAGTSDGIAIIDVSPSVSMNPVTSFSSGNVNSMMAHDNYMFLSGENLFIIAIDNQRTPVNFGSLTGFAAREPVLSGHRLFVPAGNDGLRIIDLGDIENPVQYTYSPGGTAKSVALSGNYALLAQGASGLKILNIYDPSNPQPISSITTADASDVAVDGYRALLADGTGGVKIIDISSITAPSVSGVCAPGSCLPAGSSARILTTAGNVVLAGLDTNKISIIDISDDTTPLSLSTITTAAPPEDMEVSGNYLYVAEGSSGIEIFYIANPNYPLKAGAMSVPDNSATGLDISGNTLFIADGGAVLFADISVPQSPYIFRSYNTNSYDTVRFGEFLLISDGVSGVNIADIAIESFNYKTPGTAGSININIQSNNVKSGRITVSQITGSYGNIKYYLSNNGGNNWIEVIPGGALSSFSSTGNDLRWRAVLSTTDTRKTPVIEKLEVYYKYE